MSAKKIIIGADNCSMVFYIYVIYYASHNFFTDLTVGHTSHILTYRSHYEKASVRYKNIATEVCP